MMVSQSQPVTAQTSLANAEAEPSAAGWLPALSDDARAILGVHFGLMITPGKGHVTFQTPWNRTPRAVAAFGELVAAGVLEAVDGERGRWARTYRALVDCAPAYHWVSRNIENLKGFAVMVPDQERREKPPRGWPVADTSGENDQSREAK